MADHDTMPIMTPCPSPRQRAISDNGGSSASTKAGSHPRVKKHLESQFTQDMTWDNFGHWEGLTCSPVTPLPSGPGQCGAFCTPA